MLDFIKKSCTRIAEFNSDKERKNKMARTAHVTPIPTTIALRISIQHPTRPAKANPDSIVAL
jgi:hypothetical protein